MTEMKAAEKKKRGKHYTVGNDQKLWILKNKKR